MLDYYSWIGRAEAFLDRMETISGQVEIVKHISPPCQSLPPLPKRIARYPDSMRRFCTEVSSKAVLTYVWEPPIERARDLTELFPTSANLLGGGILFDCGRLEFDFQACADNAEELMSEHAADAAIWLKAVPIINLNCGDYLGISVSDDLTDAVVYLSAYGAGNSKVFANSFDEFLQLWESVYYVFPPEIIWLLDEDRRVRNEKLSRLRSLLEL